MTCCYLCRWVISTNEREYKYKNNIYCEDCYYNCLFGSFVD